MRYLRSKKGFTLVELAIVLVVIGIILGAVLKGQELINNAKMKRAYNQYREILAAVYTYYDKYGKYPGDDNTASSRWGTGVQDGNNNGIIDGLTLGCASVSTGESCYVWEHLRLANILTGNGRTAPSNAYGGSIGIGSGTVYGLTTIWIAFTNVPVDVSGSLDQQYDDGALNTGSIRWFCSTGTALCTLYFSL